MVKTHSKCEKCKNELYPVYFRDKDKKFKPILHSGMGKQLKRVYWCIKCKKFYHKYS